ncbi:STY1053 family phage-associated protein [Cupriavidus plantarum]|uniref:STY1053 family phage-associated protein n=1 Tax=Cupriavidus plantarum TaxID=942865 RepID=UPI00339D8A1A
MPTIYVAKAFKLKHRDEEGNLVTRDFPVGNHNVPKGLHDHWYVKAHIGEEPPLDPDAQAAADELLAELEAKAKALDERRKALDAEGKALAGLQQTVSDHASELAEREQALATRTKAADEREAAIAEREKAAEAAAKQQAAGKK